MSSDSSSSKALPVGNRYSLFVGINSYASKPLKGCLNDVKIWQHILKHVGFDTTNSRYSSQLLNADATSASIKKSITDLKAKCEENDVIVIVFSGHGAELHNPDKINGYNEIFVAYSAEADFNKDSDRYIKDDEFNMLFRGFKSKNLTIIFDCCHAYDITRNPMPLVDNDVKVTVRGVPAIGLNEITEFRRVRGLSSFRNTPSHQLLSGGEYVVLSACRDRQKSVEGEWIPTTLTEKIPGLNSDNLYVGSLTFSCLQAFYEASQHGAVPLSLNWKTFTQKIRKEMALINPNQKLDQEQQVEGLIDWQVFGTERLPHLQSLVVKRSDDQEILLDGGPLYGMSDSSKWNIYHTHNLAQDSLVCKATIQSFDDASGVRATLNATIPESFKYNDLRAVCTSGYFKQPVQLILKVEDAPNETVNTSFPTDFKDFPFAEVVESTQLTNSDDAVACTIHITSLGVLVIECDHGTNHTLSNLFSLEYNEQFVRNLKTYLWATSLRINQYPPSSNSRYDVDTCKLSLARLTNLNSKVEISSRITIVEGDEFRLFACNNGSSPLYLYVFAIGPEFSVSTLYPYDNGNPVITSSEKEIPFGGLRQPLTYKDDILYGSLPHADTGRYRTIWRIILSGEEINKEFLEQSPIDAWVPTVRVLPSLKANDSKQPNELPSSQSRMKSDSAANLKVASAKHGNSGPSEGYIVRDVSVETIPVRRENAIKFGFAHSTKWMSAFDVAEFENLRKSLLSADTEFHRTCLARTWTPQTGSDVKIENSADKPDIIFVFIHGLVGDNETTWNSDDKLRPVAKSLLQSPWVTELRKSFPRCWVEFLSHLGWSKIFDSVCNELTKKIEAILNRCSNPDAKLVFITHGSASTVVNALSKRLSIKDQFGGMISFEPPVFGDSLLNLHALTCYFQWSSISETHSKETVSAFFTARAAEYQDHAFAFPNSFLEIRSDAQQFPPIVPRRKQQHPAGSQGNASSLTPASTTTSSISPNFTVEPLILNVDYFHVCHTPFQSEGIWKTIINFIHQRVPSAIVEVIVEGDSKEKESAGSLDSGNGLQQGNSSSLPAPTVPSDKSISLEDKQSSSQVAIVTATTATVTHETAIPGSSKGTTLETTSSSSQLTSEASSTSSGKGEEIEVDAKISESTDPNPLEPTVIDVIQLQEYVNDDITLIRNGSAWTVARCSEKFFTYVWPADAAATTSLPNDADVLYYEVELITGGMSQIGLVPLDWTGPLKSGNGVGDEPKTCAVDLMRHSLFLEGTETPAESDIVDCWKAGDRVGISINQRSRVQLYVNGVKVGGLQSMPIGKYMPAISPFDFQACHVYFHKEGWKYAPDNATSWNLYSPQSNQYQPAWKPLALEQKASSAVNLDLERNLFNKSLLSDGQKSQLSSMEPKDRNRLYIHAAAFASAEQLKELWPHIKPDEDSIKDLLENAFIAAILGGNCEGWTQMFAQHYNSSIDQAGKSNYDYWISLAMHFKSWAMVLHLTLPLELFGSLLDRLAKEFSEQQWHATLYLLKHIKPKNLIQAVAADAQYQMVSLLLNFAKKIPVATHSKVAVAILLQLWELCGLCSDATGGMYCLLRITELLYQSGATIQSDEFLKQLVSSPIDKGGLLTRFIGIRMLASHAADRNAEADCKHWIKEAEDILAQDDQSGIAPRIDQSNRGQLTNVQNRLARMNADFKTASASQVNVPDYQRRYHRAKVLFATGRVHEGRAEIAALLKEDVPKSFLVRVKLLQANVDFNADQFRSAHENAQAALDTAKPLPDTPMDVWFAIHQSIAASLMKMYELRQIDVKDGRDLVEEYIDKCAKYIPDDEVINRGKYHELKGTWLKLQNKLPEAAKQLEAALKLMNGQAPEQEEAARGNLADIYYQMGDYETCVQLLLPLLQQTIAKTLHNSMLSTEVQVSIIESSIQSHQWYLNMYFSFYYRLAKWKEEGKSFAEGDARTWLFQLLAFIELSRCISLKQSLGALQQLPTESLASIASDFETRVRDKWSQLGDDAASCLVLMYSIVQFPGSKTYMLSIFPFKQGELLPDEVRWIPITLTEAGSLSENLRHHLAPISQNQTKFESPSNVLSMYENFVGRLSVALCDGVTRVVIVADSELSVIPFSLFFAMKSRLVADPSTKSHLTEAYEWKASELPHFSIVYQPAILFCIPHQAPLAQTSSTPLVFGYPEGAEELEGSRRELHHVGQFFKVDPVWEGQATREEFFQRLPKSSFIHLASHGHISLLPNSNKDLALDGAFFVSKGVVSAEDLSQLATSGLRISCICVFLSFCVSSEGTRTISEGVLGLVRAFLQLGARTVIACAWDVNDDSCAQLVTKFYRILSEGNEKRPSRLLRLAQQSLCNANNAASTSSSRTRLITATSASSSSSRARPSVPVRCAYHWAPFMVYGNDDPLPDSLINTNERTVAKE